MTRGQPPTDIARHPSGQVSRYSWGDAWYPDADQADALALDLAMQEIARLRHALWQASIDRVRIPLHPELAELHQLRELVRTVHEYASATAKTDFLDADVAIERIAKITKRPPTSR